MAPDPEADQKILRPWEEVLASMIALGKTTSPEFGYSGFTQSEMWGVTHNPWNLEHTPDGSSARRSNQPGHGPAVIPQSETTVGVR